MAKWKVTGIMHKRHCIRCFAESNDWKKSAFMSLHPMGKICDKHRIPSNHKNKKYNTLRRRLKCLKQRK